MKTSVPESQIAQLTVQQVDVGELNAGPLSIGSLVVNAARLHLDTGSAELVDLRVTVSLSMTLDWRVTVTVPLVDDWTWSGVLDLGTKSVTVPLGDVACPGLQTLDVDLPALTLDNVAAALAQVRDLHLGAVVAEQILARDAVLPVPDFQLTGLGVGRVRLAAVSVPAATVEQATVARLSGDAFPVGTVTVPGLDLPATTVEEIHSENVDVDARSNPLRYGADLGVLDVTLSVTPGVRTQAEQLRLNNVRSTGSVGSVELRDVVLPYELLGLSLSQLGIHTVTVPTMEVS